MYLKIDVFEQIYRFRGLIYYGKTMVLHVYGKNYGAIEKPMVLWKNLWCYTENYNWTLIYHGKVMYMVLWKKIWYFSELLLTIVNCSEL